MEPAAPTSEPVRPMASLAELEAIGHAHGLDVVGFATAAPFVEARRVIEQRKADGLHADMGFTFRQPEYSTTPSRSLPDVQAIVVAALAYRRTEPRRDTPVAEPMARVASYAWEEYYAILKAGLRAVGERLRTDGWRTRVVVDDNAMVDRAAAVRAGLGWAGKSSNVLLPGRGSWFVLGGLLTDAPLVTTDPEPQPDGCGTCRRCLDGCPTGAIVDVGVVDARRCLSWLLQAPGMYPREFRVALGDRIYGCDDCQEVCPPNRRDERNGYPAPSDIARSTTSILAMLEDDDATVLARHDRWYIAKRDPRWLRRNALVVLGNTNLAVFDADVERRARQAVHNALGSGDAMLVAHAVWTARRLGFDDLLGALSCRDDAQVQAELDFPNVARVGTE